MLGLEAIILTCIEAKTLVLNAFKTNLSSSLKQSLCIRDKAMSMPQMKGNASCTYLLIIRDGGVCLLQLIKQGEKGTSR